MPVAVNVSSKFGSGRVTKVYGTLTLSGAYATGGDPLLASAFGAGTTKKPHLVTLVGKAGFGYEYDNEAQKLKVYSDGVAELAAGAYPAGYLADVIRFEAVFPKFG